MNDSTTTAAAQSNILHAEVAALFARYCQALDDGDGNAWGECFEPEVGAFHRASGEPRIIAGQQALAEFCDARPPGGLHVTVNSVITEQSDATVKVRSGLVYLQAPAENTPPQIMALGTYVDTLVRVEGSLRFRSREVFLNR